ncbi:MAG: hypothetical protein AAB677_03430 [Patescibacteria group bacterium]
MKYFIGLVFFAVVVIYAGYELSGLIRRPTLTLIYPTAGQTLTEELLTVRGRAAGLIKLTINGAPTTLAEDGAFAVKLLLARGYNTIEISGTDRFDRSIREILPLVYQPKS